MMKLKMPKTYYFIAVAIVFVGVAKCATQFVNIVHLDLSSAVNLPKQTLLVAQSWDWTTQEWTGNDKPYQRIRAEIDQSLAIGKDSQKLIEQQKEIAQKYPNNPQAQFAWGYATYTSLPQWTSSYEEWAHNPITDAIASLPATNCYNYARLRFLLPLDYFNTNEAQIVANAHLVDALGQRLLQHNPNDLDVKYKLIDVDVSILGRSPTDLAVKNRALLYSQEMIQAKPQLSRYRTLPASIYVTCWAHTNNPADARAGIASYEDYLRIAPPDEEFRPDAQRLIKMLQDALAHSK